MAAILRIEDLPWLLEAPDDFDQRCKVLGKASGDGSGELRLLAAHSLDCTQSAYLSRIIGRRLKNGDPLADFTKVRLALFAAWTNDYLLDCLPAAAARHGVAITLSTTHYDQIVQEALDPGSNIYRDGFDLALIAVDHRWLQLEQSALEDGAADATVTRAIDKLRLVCSSIRRQSGAAIVLSTLAQPISPLFGGYDVLQAGSVRSLIQQANIKIVDLAREIGAYILDVGAIAEAVGTERWFDRDQWNAYKLPFAADFSPIYSDYVARLIGAIYGRSRKCLVLDLDNTLWGGAIGDDGLAGIKIGQGSAVGEAFLRTQMVAAELKARGIILAVCSKNSEDNARLPFKHHADMVLKETDISVFCANWMDKPGNLQTIAKTLNIGLDSLVFLDDNPAERAHVRAALPMVAVPEVGNDPSDYADLLMAAGYFEAVAFSSDDRLRTMSYAMDQERAALRETMDASGYLASLSMNLSMGPIDEGNRQRVTQLINKTNQFNLTTRRYTEAEVRAVEGNDSFVTIQTRLRDKFGDLGLIAVIIARMSHEGAASIMAVDAWLMSCRVLGRRVEDAMLGRLAALARDVRATAIEGQYIASAKNEMVADFYPRLGFHETGRSDDGRTVTYRLPLDRFEPNADLPFMRTDLLHEMA